MNKRQLAEIPPAVQTLGQAFLRGLIDALGEDLVMVVFFGAAVFPETLPTGDVDFHVILKSRLSVETCASLEALHRQMAGDFPPLGGEMDGYYLLLEDAQGAAPPQSQMWQKATDNAWALHRAHIRAGRCEVLFGPDPKTIYREPTWDELEWALYDELAYVERNLDRYPDYCILNLCRLIYSFETREVVVSKAWAADWAESKHPRWQKLIDAAKRSYERQASAAQEEMMAAEVRAFFRFADQQIHLFQARYAAGWRG